MNNRPRGVRISFFFFFCWATNVGSKYLVAPDTGELFPKPVLMYSVGPPHDHKPDSRSVFSSVNITCGAR